MSPLLVAKLCTAAVVAGFGVLLASTAIALSRRNKAVSVGPVFALAAVVTLALYGLGSLIDLVAAANAPAGTSPYESFVERLALERFFGQLLPLREKPLLAAPVHVGAALGLYLATASFCCWIGRFRKLRPEGAHRFWRRVYDLCGYGPLAADGARQTARRWARNIEPRFGGWLRPLLLGAPLLLLVAFFELHYEDPATPPLRPFLFGLCVALYGAALVNLLASRSEDPATKETPAATEPTPPPDPLAWLEALRARGFTVSTTPSLRVAPPAASTTRARTAVPTGAGGALREELTQRLIGDGGLWPHQQALLARVIERRTHQLVATPPRSGKTAALQLLCAHTAVVAGENALVVLRDAETAEEACARFAELLAGTSWRENLRCTLAGPQVTRLLAERRSPMITFADPDTLEGLVLAHDECRYFLEHLGLVAFEDIERHSGVRAANLAFVARRLAAVLEALAATPVQLATLGEPAQGFESYAETLLGVNLEVIAADTAPGATVFLHSATAPARVDRSGPALPGAALAAAEAAARGLPYSLSGFARLTRTELERAVAEVAAVEGTARCSEERARVSVGELVPAQLARLFAVLRHSGSLPDPRSGGDGAAEHRMLVLAGEDPLSRWLLADLGRAAELARAGRRLVADLSCAHLARRHLLRCVAQLPVEEGWARTVFGGALIDGLVTEGLVARKPQVVLRGEPPQPAPTTRVHATRPIAPACGPAETISSEPVEVVDRATSTVIRRLDPSRAPLVAHPGAVLLYRGRRFAVPLVPARYAPGARILAELCEEDAVTVRVRALDIALADGAADQLRPVSLGGAAVLGGLLAVEAEEQVSAVRRYHPDGACTVSAFLPVITRYRSVAFALSLGEDTAEPSAHALVHALRPVLASQLDCGEEGLCVAHTMDLDGRGPALLLLDTYEGGAGFARAVDLQLLGRCLRLVDELLAQRCCDGSGCPRCVRTRHCHQADAASATLDRSGAQALVARLLGRSGAER